MGTTEWRIALGDALRVGFEANDVSCTFDVCGVPDTWCIYSRADWSVVYQAPRVGPPAKALPPSTGWICTDVSRQGNALNMPAVICTRGGALCSASSIFTTSPASVSFASDTKGSTGDDGAADTAAYSDANYGDVSVGGATAADDSDLNLFDGNWDGAPPEEIFALLDFDDNGYITAAEFIKGGRESAHWSNYPNPRACCRRGGTFPFMRGLIENLVGILEAMPFYFMLTCSVLTTI